MKYVRDKEGKHNFDGQIWKIRKEVDENLKKKISTAKTVHLKDSNVFQ